MKKLRGAGTRVCHNRQYPYPSPSLLSEETDLELVLAGFRLGGGVEEILSENLLILRSARASN
jgi:hypothetical protein